MATKRIRADATSFIPSTPHQTSSSSAAAADVIAGNDDLLTEILRWLPARSLLNFKSVSKHWLELISSRHLSRRLNPNSTVSALFLPKFSSFRGKGFNLIPLDGNPSTAFPNLLPSICILQSCNGLLCCERYQKKNRTLHHYIYNPTTHQFTTLPQLALHTVSGMILAFDPRTSPDYKVICVRPIYYSPPRYRIQIYSSQTPTWRVSGDVFTAPGNMEFRDGVFWNGSIHWITNAGTMLSFDVNQERFLPETPMPEIRDWNRRSIRYFGECRDHLHLVLISGTRAPRFIVYEMERDYSRWFVKYQVDLLALKTLFSDIRGSHFDVSKLRYRYLIILSLVREENDGDSFLVLRTFVEAVRYSFKDKTIKKLCDTNYAIFTAYQYIETIACV